MKKTSPLFRLSFACLLLLLTGCGKLTLYSNLPEKQANEMITLLRQRNISAGKAPGLEGAWNVVVGSANFPTAMAILNNYGYPQDRFDTIGEVFQKSGLVSSPLEERVRYMYALSENLAETIAHIAGVVTARVHIVLPENNPYMETTSPASASVFISYRPESNVEESIRDIKYLVTNSIEGLSYDKVSVALFPAPLTADEIADKNQLVSVLSIQMTRSSLLYFWLFVLIMLVSVMAISFVLAKILFDYLAVKKEEKMRRESITTSLAAGESEEASGDDNGGD